MKDSPSLLLLPPASDVTAADAGEEEGCGSCKHWRLQPPDPHALDGVERGECRERLHSQLVPTRPGFPPGMVVYYPVIPATMSPCSRFSPRVDEEETADDA